MESFSDFLKNKGYKTLSEAPGDVDNSEVEDTTDYEMPSFDETPGDEDEVIALTPVEAAPRTMLIAAISDSA